MPKPSTSYPTWATDGAADIDTPPTQEQDLGWVFEDIPPAGYFNWKWNLDGQWLTWLATALPVVDTLEDGVDELTVAPKLAIIDENDRDKIPGNTNGDGGTVATNVADVCATGDGVIYAHTAGADPLRLVSRADMGTVIRSFTKTGAASAVNRIVTDGIRVYACYGQIVEAWTIATGASVWTYDHGASVLDLAVYDGRLFLVGLTGTGTKHARALLAATGTIEWSYQHSAAGQLSSCVAVHGRLIVGGDASSFASGAHLRALQYATGNDATNEGGTAADTTGVAWNVVLGGVVATRMLATDGRKFYLSVFGTSVLGVYGIADGAGPQVSKTITGVTFAAIACDHEYAYVVGEDAGPDGWCYCLDGATLAARWRYYADNDNVRSVSSDGAAVFVGLQATALDPVIRLVRGNTPGIFRVPTLGGGGSERFQVNPRAIVPE